MTRIAMRGGAMGRVTIGLGLSLGMLVACDEKRAAKSPIDMRIGEARGAWDRYSANDRALISRGMVRPGLDELAAYIARGKPAFHWKTELDSGKCNVLLHEKVGDATQVDTAIYACNGTIEQVVEVEPTLPCWRLAAVTARVLEKQAYFESKPLPHQWELLEGILRRGQTSEDVSIAFGKPYNTGVEAREDGTNAQTRVYVDSTGEAYGLYITLVNDKVSGWRIPAERQLTPEAQQKRLDATEARLMAQLKTMEQRAQQRHNEEMKLLNQLQSRGDEVVAKQTSGLRLAAMFGPIGAMQSAIDTTKKVLDVVEKVTPDKPKDPPPAEPPKPEPAKPDPKPAGAAASNTTPERSITVGACTFHDSRPDLGRTCGGKGHKACRPGFKCHGATKGKGGQCVPELQLAACKAGAAPGSTSPPPTPSPGKRPDATGPGY